MRARLRQQGSVMVALACAYLAAASPAVGEVVSARLFRGDGWLRVDLRARELLDARTVSTIESGLPGTCVYHLRLEDRRGVVVGEGLLEMSLRFDLWEKRYLLEGRGGRQALPSLAAADSAWSCLTGEGVCRLDRLQSAGEYRLAVRIAVQPLAAADRERLSRYVSRHSGGNDQQLNLDLGAIVSGIFGHRRGSERTMEHTGAWFRPSELEERP